MLASLTLRNFAIVDELSVSWSGGLTVLTGETGAGKSIMIDAVGALLGDRIAPTDVRAGESRAYLEAVFDLDADRMPDSVRETLREFGLEIGNEEGLILSRDIAGSGFGRSVARVNGRAVPASVLTEVGQACVDIHGQSEHLSLLRSREQLVLLDRFAGAVHDRRTLGELVRHLRDARSQVASLFQEQRAAARERDLLDFQVQEIDAAGIQADEEGELQVRRSKLRNLERLRAVVSLAQRYLMGEDDQVGAVGSTGGAVKSLQEATRVDPALAHYLELVVSADAQLADAERGLHRYLEDLGSDAGELEALEERAMIVGELKRKYGATLADILHYADQARQRLEGFERIGDSLEELESEVRRLEQQAATHAAQLSKRRRDAAVELEAAAQRELTDLGLAGARLKVEISSVDSADGLEVVQSDGSAQRLRFDSNGVDRVEMLFAASSAEVLRPLALVASGGELARVALALKTVLSDGDDRGSLIFDEVDVGVGGRTAGVVGQKLWRLARRHQVLCVTHLPQVAVYADDHLLVVKEEYLGRPRSRVQRLDEPQRVTELAAMLDGPSPSEAALQNARQMLERARAFKADAQAIFPASRP